MSDRAKIVQSMTALGYDCVLEGGMIVFYEPPEKQEECFAALLATGYNASYGRRPPRKQHTFKEEVHDDT